MIGNQSENIVVTPGDNSGNISINMNQTTFEHLNDNSDVLNISYIVSFEGASFSNSFTQQWDGDQ